MKKTFEFEATQERCLQIWWLDFWHMAEVSFHNIIAEIYVQIIEAAWLSLQDMKDRNEWIATYQFSWRFSQPIRKNEKFNVQVKIPAL